MRTASILFSCVLLILTCCNGQSKMAQKHLITDAMKAMISGDTIQLYRLTDTTFFFSIYGKEGFSNTVKVIKEKIKNCNEIIDKLNIQQDEIKNEYIVSICESQPDSKSQVVFTLAVHHGKILTFKIKLDTDKMNPGLQIPIDGLIPK